MVVNPQYKLKANEGQKFKVFSNSWLGTGGNENALMDFNGCVTKDCEEKIKETCFLKDKADEGLYAKCKAALDGLYGSKT